MVPNFEPADVVVLWKGLLRRGDLLLVSANLAPGPDYRAGVKQVLPQYDNPLTRDWLALLLIDLGLPAGSGEMQFDIEEAPPHSGLLRIRSQVSFVRPATLTLEGEPFDFPAGSKLQIFFSYRHTESSLRQLLSSASLHDVEGWISETQEEGVFLAESGNGRHAATFRGDTSREPL
jgi:hypothetical protein